MLYLRVLAASSLVATTMFAAPAISAETIRYTADLTSAAAVPPADSAAAGTAEITIDTQSGTVSWVIDTFDLSGNATAAHIHGPAFPGKNAPPEVDLSGSIPQGSADITDEQIADIRAGKTYVNVHTEKFPGGEIRSQLAASDQIRQTCRASRPGTSSQARKTLRRHACRRRGIFNTHGAYTVRARLSGSGEDLYTSLRTSPAARW